MSDFALSLEQRRRLMEGDYSPLVFKGSAHEEPLPYGCKDGARYVLAWSREQRIAFPDGEVVKLPAMPVHYITVTSVVHRSAGGHSVRFDVSDYRDSTVWLAPCGGYQLSRQGSPDHLPVVVDESVRAKTREEFWHQQRLARFAAERRKRNRARRQRAA